MVHTFASLVSEVEVIEAERGPVCVKVTKDSNLGPQRMDGMTVVHLDWPTACQIAEVVTHRLEEPEHEDDPGNPGAFCEHDSGSHCKMHAL